MENQNQIVFSDANIVTIKLALYEAECSLRARAEVIGLREEYSGTAESALKFADECHALSEYIIDQIFGGKSNG